MAKELSIWPLVLVSVLLLSLASYGWAMKRFFTKPAGDHAGMKVIRACGILFALLHTWAILAAPHIGTVRGSAGIAVYLSGLGVFYWALRAHGRTPLSAAFSPDNPTHLVHWGPYRFIRHPFYTAYLATWAGGVVATESPWLALTVAAMFWIYLRAARIEERKFAQSPLAEAYRRYARTTGRFLPNPYRWMKGRGKEEDAASLAQHRA